MTVRELILKLSEFDPDKVVVQIQTDYENNEAFYEIDQVILNRSGDVWIDALHLEERP